MTGVSRRAAARRAAAASGFSGALPDDEEETQAQDNWAVGFTEHRIDSVIYEHEEEDEIPPDEREDKTRAEHEITWPMSFPLTPRNSIDSAAFTPNSPHEYITRQRSLTNRYKTRDEDRVIIVCHDESSNEVPYRADSSRASVVDTPSPIIDDPFKVKKETGVLLIEVSDKLNSMPKHHPVTLSNSISTDDETLTDGMKRKFSNKFLESVTPDSVFTESDADDGASDNEKLESSDTPKGRLYQRQAGAQRQSLDESTVSESKMLRPPKELTLSVPNLHALTTSSPVSRRSTPRISHSPRLTPKPSPRLSPRIAHTVINVKKKISEAVKNEMSSFMSDQMVSVSYKSLESFIQDSNLSGLQTYLATRSVLIDDRDENGATALIFAAQKGEAKCCNELLLHGADIHAEDNDQWCALLVASKEGHEDVVATLLDHGANIHQKDMGGWTSLMWASYKGHTDLALLLLDHGADPNTQGPHHMTSLMWASGRGHTDIVKALLAKGAKVSIGDKFGTTPLIWASRKGYVEICRALLERGSNPDATGMYSWTALLVATRGNYVDLVRLILERKPNVNALDKDGGTALTVACKEGYTEIAQALLVGGAYVNIQDRNGDSNLIYAARGGHRTVVEALMKRYADIDLVGKENKNALYWAIEKGHLSVVKMLLTANPNLEHSTDEGDTALLRAVRSKNAEMVQLLIDKRCKVNGADKKGDTCLHIAMRGRSKRIVEILLRNPKNSQMLYRPNRAGETPYNIDLAHQKTILGQIFGARRLNTNEDNENMLGYDLYSSSLADILSEPSLSMPIAVGLYAKWGSGKSFLIRKLKEEMRSFARQWVEPLFSFSPLVMLLLVHLSLVGGLVTGAPAGDWRVGLGVASSLLVVTTVFLVAVWQGSRRYDLQVWYWLSVRLEKHMAGLKLVMQVIFCSPPGPQHRHWKDSLSVRPLKFVFAEGAKPGSTAAGESSVVQMLGSLFDKVEEEYGMFATRFYRAFRPKSQGANSAWRYRRLCCIPYIVIYFVTLFCIITVSILGARYGFHELHLASSDGGEDKVQLGGEGVDLEEAVPTIQGIGGGDEVGDDDDDRSQESNEDGAKTEESEDPYQRPFHGLLINPLLYTSIALVSVVLIANLHTLFRMLTSLLFSHRRHLLRAVSRLETLKAEGYLHTLKAEVILMVEMVKCLDAFSFQQTRLVAIVDGLESCEQEKVLSVLDAVHTLFTDTSAPFIIVLAIDPHIITKAIELHVHRVFSESSISGHDYLRNIVHLPFYLQNSGLRKVKQAQQVAERARMRSGAQQSWLEVETDSVSMATTSAMGGISHIPANRRLSTESGVSMGPGGRRATTKGSRRVLKQSDSIASSIGSNLNRVGGAQDLTKVLLTDDYFSDINPRSMRRLMNVVYITGRLLKAFHIDFNWYHLASWINIIEQWPYRASWLILYHEAHEDTIEDKLSLKDLYEKVKHQIPNSKDMEPLLEMDKDEKKFEIFLSMHKSSLHVTDLKVFLPFTINLDPFIRKVIKEDQPQFEEFVAPYGPPQAPPWAYQAPFDVQSKTSTLSKRNAHRPPHKVLTGSLPHHASMNPLMWGYPPHNPYLQPLSHVGSVDLNLPPAPQHQLPELGSILTEPVEKQLSSMTLDDLCSLLTKVVGLNTTLVPKYQDEFQSNNINGKVLSHCSLDELKKELKMSFGDWELIKMVIMCLREREASAEEEDFITRNVRFGGANFALDGALGAGSIHLGVDDTPLSSLPNSEASSSRRGSSRAAAGGADEVGGRRFARASMVTKQDARTQRRPNPRMLHHLSEEHEDVDESSALLPEEGTNGDGAQRLTVTPKCSPGREDSDNDYRDLPQIMVHQLNMEEQMIFGALQTLSEEACEDALQQQESKDLLPNTLTYTPSTEDVRRSRGIGVILGGEEVDMMYLQSSPLLPHRVVTHFSDGDNISVTSSNFSPTRNASGTSISRTPSTRTAGATGAAQENRKQSTFSRKDSEESIRDGAGVHKTRFSDRRDSRKTSKESRKDSRDSMGYPVDHVNETSSDHQDSDRSKRNDSVTSTGRFNQQPVLETQNALGPPKPKSSLASLSKLSAPFDNSSGKSSYPTVTFADDARESNRLKNNGITADEVMSDPECHSAREEVSSALLRAPMGKRRQRPKSLNLSSSATSRSSDLEEISPDDAQLQFEELGSLPNLNEDGIPIATRPNLAQQISATSMEKVRKLKQHIRRVINPQDGNRSDSLSGSISADDPEASPLVVSTPVTAKDNNNMVFSPGSTEMNNVGDGYPSSRRSSNPVSPTKPHDSVERETHV